MKKNYLFFALLLLFPLFAQSQSSSSSSSNTSSSNTSTSTTDAGILWRCELPGGIYIVNVRSITSLSSHEYIVDNVARVTEVTIGTTGDVVGRFYYIEPITKSPLPVGQSALDKIEEKLQEGAQRVGVEPIWKKVLKTFPGSTHAHTVEYRLESKDQLDQILSNLEKAWRNRQGGTLRIS